MRLSPGQRRAPRARVIALAVLGLLGCDPGRPELDDRAAPVDSIEIATWNLAWLHGRDGKGAIARREADYARLRGYAARLDADVIALQEVSGEDAARRVLDPDVYAFALSSRRDAQRTGFAYRRSLRVTRHPDHAALDVGGLRHGTDITVHLGEHRLRLLAVHLKSGCWARPLGRGPAACRKLARQLPALEAWIDARAREGVPFAVLGDFNRRMAEAEPFWLEIDDGDPPGADLTLVTAGRVSQCWNGAYPRFIDHIVLDARAAAWLVPGSFVQQLYDPADARHRATLSDHCPISVRLRPGSAAATPEPPAPEPPAPEPPRPEQPGQKHARPERPAPERTTPAGRAGALEKRAGAPAKRAERPAGAGSQPMPIKGNVSRGRKLYHLPSCPSYDLVRIDPGKGERLFASEAQAHAAGFRKAGNCP